MKKWRNITIFSLVFILVETIAAIIFLFPYYSRQMVFSNIEKGNLEGAVNNYKMLSDTHKQNVQKYLDDYAVSLCQKYIDGDMSYEEIATSMDVINAVDLDGEIGTKYLIDITKNEFSSAIKELCDVNISHDTKKAFEIQGTITKVLQRIDTDSREKIMMEILNSDYKSFLNEEISADQMNMLIGIVSSYAYYDAYTNCTVLSQNVEDVCKYREKYEKARKLVDDKKYFNALNVCSKIKIDEWDTRYSKLFSELYDDAYSKGMVYYKETLEDYVASKKKKKALSLIDKLEKYYGDKIDIKSVKDKLLADWQEKALTFVEKPKKHLKKDMGDAYEGKVFDAILIYDIDGDSTPEMLFFNSEHATRACVGCAIYSLSGKKAKYLGYTNILYFGNDGGLVIYPPNGGDEGYALASISNGKVETGRSCYKAEDKYYIDGEEATDADYLSASTEILEHASDKIISNSKFGKLDNATKYILSFD